MTAVVPDPSSLHSSSWPRCEARAPRLGTRLVPRILAMVYYQLSLVLYLLKPASSQRLNADFEDHAEHEYALFVEERP